MSHLPKSDPPPEGDGPSSDEAVVRASWVQSLTFIRSLIGAERLSSLFSGGLVPAQLADNPSELAQRLPSLYQAGALPTWLAELLSEQANEALDRASVERGELHRVMSPTFWTRAVASLTPSGSPPTLRCLLHSTAEHVIDVPEAESGITRDAVLRAYDEIRMLSAEIDVTRRLRALNHDLEKALRYAFAIPCTAVWSLCVWACRLGLPWAIYLRDEWGIDLDGPSPQQPHRDVASEFDYRLLTVAKSQFTAAQEIMQAIDGAFDDQDSKNPCEDAIGILSHVLRNDWISNVHMMSSGLYEDQRLAAGIWLTAKVLTRVSLGHSGTNVKTGGRVGASLDAALHRIGHTDPSTPHARAHDDTLIREALSRIWSEPKVRHVDVEGRLSDPSRDAEFRRIVDGITYRIRKQGIPRKRSQQGGPDQTSELREVQLAAEPENDGLDPLEEVCAREEAELEDSRLQELLDLIPLLPPRQRQIAELKLVQRLSHRQIAALLPLTEGGVKANWSKVKKNLRRLYGERRAHDSDVA